MNTMKINHMLMMVCLLLVTSSCNKDYLNRFPLDGPSSGSFISNEAELKMSLYGCYESLNFTVNGEPRAWISILDVTSDIGWNRSNSDMQQVGNGSHDSENIAIKKFWTSYYNGIGRCNFVLDNIDNLKDKLNPEVYEQTVAEVRFLRALNYHYLAELFGGVPLITTTLTLSEAQVPRNTKSEVVDFVIAEMDLAAKHLPEKYGDDVYHGRATKAAALAIKARTALFNEKWDIAAEAAKTVIDLKTNGLHPSFQELFSYDGQSSSEIILSLQYLKGVISHNTPHFFMSRLASGVSNEVPTQSVVDSYESIDGLAIDKSPLYNPDKPFENRDPRLGYTIVLPGSRHFNYQFETHPDSLQVWNYNVTPAVRVNNTDATNAYSSYSGYLWRKYTDVKDIPDKKNSDLNLILIRYAEVLLIYAEAKIEANQIDGSVYEAINLVRQRPSVEMPPIQNGKSQSELRSIVRKERKYEFAVEGLRLFDIRRWKIAEEVMPGPLLGRIRTEFLSNAPAINSEGTPNYTNVANRNEMRLIETRNFNPNRDYLWPIPNIDMLTNKELKQNAGY